jgi:hypothetical protein
VEVPAPKDRRLERGGADSIWEYPRAPKWGENVFEIARKFRKTHDQRATKAEKAVGNRGIAPESTTSTDSGHYRRARARVPSAGGNLGVMMDE